MVATSTAPYAPADARLVSRRHVDFCRTSSAICPSPRACRQIPLCPALRATRGF
ncbi:putative leader peptide [Streptomyces sp. NPDC059491]|uniref:putative leader peptide n=1 Tax=Streptomyces sp. NPDC059491 TaxID=3346850 RepID=UPI003686DFE8